jgi:hypothetical protein
VIKTTPLYPRADVKDTWAHTPTGGTGWEHTKKSGAGEQYPSAPAHEPFISSATSGNIEKVKIEAYKLAAGEKVLALYIRAYGKVSKNLYKTSLYIKEAVALSGEVNNVVEGWWSSAALKGERTEAELAAMELQGTNTNETEAIIRSWYIEIETELAEETVKPVGGSVPRSKTGTPPPRFPSHDIEEGHGSLEPPHVLRNLARLFFGVLLLLLIGVCLLGLVNAWGDSLVIAAAETLIDSA